MTNKLENFFKLKIFNKIPSEDKIRDFLLFYLPSGMSLETMTDSFFVYIIEHTKNSDP